MVEEIMVLGLLMWRHCCDYDENIYPLKLDGHIILLKATPSGAQIVNHWILDAVYGVTLAEELV